MSRHKKIAFALVLWGCAIAIAAKAAEPSALPTSTGVATFGQLDELRSQNALLAEAVKGAELRAKLNGSATPAKPTPPTETRPVPARRVEPAPSIVTASTAQVQMVSGVGNALVAHIAMQNGTTVPARVGTYIAGLGTVRTISINEVVVANKKQTIVVPFAAEPVAPTSSAPASSSFTTAAPFPIAPSMSMPPLPAGMPNGVR